MDQLKSSYNRALRRIPQSERHQRAIPCGRERGEERGGSFMSTSDSCGLQRRWGLPETFRKVASQGYCRELLKIRDLEMMNAPAP